MTVFGKNLGYRSITVSATTYTLDSSSANSYIYFTADTDITVTLAAGFPDDCYVNLHQYGAGTVYLETPSGVSVTYGSDRGISTSGQHSFLLIRHSSGNNWQSHSHGDPLALPFSSSLIGSWMVDDLTTTAWPPQLGRTYNSTFTVSGAGTITDNWNKSPYKATLNPTVSTTVSFVEDNPPTATGYTFFQVGTLKLTGGDSWSFCSNFIAIPFLWNSTGLCVARQGGDTRTVISTATLNAAGIYDGMPAVLVMAQDTAPGSYLDRGLVLCQGTTVTGSSVASSYPAYNTLFSTGAYGVYPGVPIAAFGVYGRALNAAEMQVLANTLARIFNCNNKGSLPTDYPLDAWWDIEDAPDLAAGTNWNWLCKAGRQADYMSNTTSGGPTRGGTTFPGNVIGATSAFINSQMVWSTGWQYFYWATSDGNLTLFIVTRASSLADATAATLVNGNSGTESNHFRFCANVGGDLTTHKNLSARLTVMAAASYSSKADMAMVLVATYTPTNISTTVLWADGVVTEATVANATSIANPGAFCLNRYGDPAAQQPWGAPSLGAGVIGKGLTAAERLSLAKGLARRHGIR